MFSGDDDELSFSSAKPRPSGSKLQSLFAQEESYASSAQQSLGYTAKKAKPAQTPATSNTAATTAPASTGGVAPATAAPASASSTSVIFATLVNLIRYDGSTPVPVGPRAVALLKNISPASPHPIYALVAYEPSTQKQDCVATLIESFTFSLSPPAYAMFYDDRRQYWCIQLPADQVEPMAKHVAMCKHAQSTHTGTHTGALITQDLLPAPNAPTNSNERAAATGDSIKLKYTMSLTSATHPKDIGAVIGAVGSDEKPKQVKLGGKKELVGLEQGVVGMNKGGRRFIVVPAQMGYGTQAAGNIPANSTLLLEVTVIKIKYAEGTPTTNPTPATTTTAQANTTTAAPAAAPVATAANTAAQPPASTASTSVPAVAALSSPSSADADEEEHRSQLSKKMAMLGFRMPGLPGALDPEHQAAAVAAARRMSVESRGEEEQSHSTPPSPAHSHVSQNSTTTVPALTIPATNAAGRTSSASPAPMSTPTLTPTPIQPIQAQPTQQTQQQQQQYYPPTQPVQLQQPMQMPSTPHQPQQQYQQNAYQPIPQQSQQQQQPQQPGSYYQPEMQMLQHQPLQSPLPQQQQQQLYNAVSPAHISPSHTPHSHSMSHLSTGYLYPHSQQLPSYGQPISSPSYHNTPTQAASLLQIESKLDAIQASLTQSARILGTHSTSLLYDTPLNAAQLIKGLNLLVQERDEAKQKQEAAEKRVSELTTRLNTLQERHESYVADQQRQMDRRYEAHSEDIKAKNQQISDLQTQGKKLEQELQSIRIQKEEVEQRVIKVQQDLNAEKEITIQKQDADKQVVLLTEQIESLKLQLSDRDRDVQDKIQQQTYQYEQEIQQWTSKLQQQQQQSEQQQHALQHQIQTLTQQHQQALQQLQLTQQQAEQQHRQDITDISRLQAEVSQSQQETQSIIDQARQVRQAEHEQMKQKLEQVKQEEYERGQQDTLAEVKVQMTTLKDKAKTAIDALQQEKSELEQQIALLSEEKNEVIATSRNYIEKVKQQAAERMSSLEERIQELEAEVEEKKQSVLKQLYGGVSRVLQEYGQHRWRAAEVAQTIKAEMTFIITGEKPEVQIDTDRENTTQADQHTEQQPHADNTPEQQNNIGAAVNVAQAPTSEHKHSPKQENTEQVAPSAVVAEHQPVEHQQQSAARKEEEKTDSWPSTKESPAKPAIASTTNDATPDEKKEKSSASVPASTSASIPSISAAANPSEVNGVDVTGTFEYPVPAHQRQKTETQKVDDESTDVLAPLAKQTQPPPPILKIDPRNTGNVIAPPTPTLLTPPAGKERSHTPTLLGPVKPAPAHPVSSAPPFGAGAGADPFADPFAEEIDEMPASAQHKPKPNAATTKSANPLFDDDDHNDGMFPHATKPVVAKTNPSGKSSVFGDADDDDDGPLFKK